MLGRHHPAIRRLRALRGDAAQRRAESVFLAEGIHLAQEALLARAAVEMVLTSPRLARREEGRRLLEQLQQAKIVCEQAPDALLDSLQDAQAPQPILMLVRRSVLDLEGALGGSASIPLIVVCDGIQDPGNLGSMLRTADAAGATAFIVSGASADPFHPRAVRATMGSIFRLPPLATEIEVLLPALRARGILTLAADPRSGENYDACDLTPPLALFFGSEGRGLTSELESRLDRRARVPMRAGVESLSVAAAAAVLLFEAARQRKREVCSR